MCGIWGYQFPEGIDRQYDGFTSKSIAMSMLMAAMDARGGDSFGFAMRVKDKATVVVRDLGQSVMKTDPQVLAGCRQVIAHTRKASTGAVSVANAHPFRVRHIIGVHNGYINNHRHLNDRLNRKCDVDSEHIFHHLAEGRNMDELSATGAAVWIDDNRPDVIHFVKSTVGSFAVAGIGPLQEKNSYANCRAVMFASTEESLELALGLAGLPHFIFGITSEIHYEIENGTLWNRGQMDFNAGQVRVDARACGHHSVPLITAPDQTTSYYREHPLLKRLVSALLEPDGTVKQWLFEADDIAELTRLAEKPDTKGLPGEIQCEACWQWRTEKEVHYGSDRRWLCDVCLIEEAGYGMC